MLVVGENVGNNGCSSLCSLGFVGDVFSGQGKGESWM